MTGPDEPFHSDHVALPEGRVRVITAGDHGPPVLLLSGGGVDSATLSWRHLIPDLAADHRVFAPDWPGQGRSTPWNGIADHDRLMRCVTEVLDHYGLDRVAVVGLSQGGALTLAYAVERPERVERLVALAPAGTISFPPVVHQVLWLTARSRLLNSTLPTRMFRTREGVARFARTSLFAGLVEDFDDVVDEIMAEVAAHGAGSSDWQNHSIGFWRMNVDLRLRLGEISCPALFLQGDKDIGVRPRQTVEAAGRVPGARLELLEGNGHWLNRQSPERVNSLIRGFLT